MIVPEDNYLATKLDFLVLDEADKFFQLGFFDVISEILYQLKNQKTALLFFSATLPKTVESAILEYIEQPTMAIFSAPYTANANIKQKFVYCSTEVGKRVEITNMLQKGCPVPILVFVDTIERCLKVYERAKLYCSCGYINSQMTEKHRNDVVAQFRKGELAMLICTDLVARGIDFKNVKMVVNYDCPENVVSYIHRVGRTGRGAREGAAVTFVGDNDSDKLKRLAKVLQQKDVECPEWMEKVKF